MRQAAWNVVGLLWAMLLVAPCARAGDTEDRRDILAVEAALCRAFEAADAKMLERHLDAGFTLVDSHGMVTDRAANLAEVASREPRYRVFRNQDHQIRLHGDAAIVIGVTHVEGEAQGQAFVADFRFTDTWIRHPDGWKLAASHASRLPATP
ncbi:nuclear transport factor 2 family protein [Pseudoxanthomonas beigongshangi]